MSLPGKNSLKALYSGNLYMPHINWPLLMEAFSEHSDVDFIFLGSNRRLIAEKYLKKLVDESNVFFCDAVPAEEVAHYLAAADILLLAYKPDYFNEYAYPHKMMEYLASGKPVVANYFQDLESESDLVYMATNDEHWLRQLDYVVKNLTDCSSPSKVAARSEFARRNTYSARVAEIENIIAESLRRRG
ncbi:MAG TPA: glycosyltransferase [Chryseosolibacter sp.]|nr:glycosyltransferase [Chryseosolibacter sp.]